MDEGKCKQLVKDLNEPEIIKEDIRIKVIGETGSEKAALLKSELESKGYINVGLESQKSIQNSTIELKRINRKYLEQLKNDIDLSTFQVVYSPDYEEKYDIYIKIK